MMQILFFCSDNGISEGHPFISQGLPEEDEEDVFFFIEEEDEDEEDFSEVEEIALLIPHTFPKSSISVTSS